MQRDRRVLWIGLGVVLLLFLMGPMGHGAFGWAGPHPAVVGTEPERWAPGFGAGGPLVFLPWLLLIGGVILLSRNRRSYEREQAFDGPPSAEDVLRWRYAAGEISRAEYFEMLRIVQGRATGAGAEAEGSA